MSARSSNGAPFGELALDRSDVRSARGGLFRRLVASLTARSNQGYEALLARRKRALLGELGGTVLEIGPGTGSNLAHFSREVDWIGVEPSLPMQAHLLGEAERRGVRGRLVTGTAERLPVPDASVDAVVGTLVLCSVSDVGRSLAEVRRVLRPGGRFVFVEHVAAARGSGLRFAQSVIAPLWRVIGDGCRSNQDTEALLERAAFSTLDIERFRVPLGFLAPHVAGVAVR